MWSVDGARLFYATDRHGQYDLYSATAAGQPDGKLHRASAFVETRLTDTAEVERAPSPSPDGSSLAYTRGEGALVVSGADGANSRVVLDHWGSVTFSWAPDSRWLALAREDRWHNHDIWIVPAEGGAPVNVSQNPQDDTDPVWSQDGRRLYWLSRRHAGSADVWFASLTRADHERTPGEWLLLFEDAKPAKENGKAGEPGSVGERPAGKTAGKGGKTGTVEEAERKPARPLSIDLAGIHDRARPLTSLPGDEASIARATERRRRSERSRRPMGSRSREPAYSTGGRRRFGGHSREGRPPTGSGDRSRRAHHRTGRWGGRSARPPSAHAAPRSPPTKASTSASGARMRRAGSASSPIWGTAGRAADPPRIRAADGALYRGHPLLTEPPRGYLTGVMVRSRKALSPLRLGLALAFLCVILPAGPAAAQERVAKLKSAPQDYRGREIW